MQDGSQWRRRRGRTSEHLDSVTTLVCRHVHSMHEGHRCVTVSIACCIPDRFNQEGRGARWGLWVVMPRAAITDDEGNKALEAAGTDIKYLLSRHEVSIENQKLFYHHGVTSLEKLSNFAKDRDDLVAVLKDHWESDASFAAAQIQNRGGPAGPRHPLASQVHREPGSLSLPRNAI